MPRARRQAVPQVLAEFVRRGCDPLDAMCELLQFSMPMTAEEAASPVVQSWLGGDYELCPSDDPERPLTLRIRARLRAETAVSLMRFSYPVLKSVTAMVAELTHFSQGTISCGVIFKRNTRTVTVWYRFGDSCRADVVQAIRRGFEPWGLVGLVRREWLPARRKLLGRAAGRGVRVWDKNLPAGD